MLLPFSNTTVHVQGGRQVGKLYWSWMNLFSRKMLALFSRSDTYHTIKHYWQLHSKLHLWFVYCVSRIGNPKSASGTALLCWVGNISDSHQSLLISDYNGDQTWKWKCSCCRAGVGTNHFSTDATGKMDYNHSPVSCASWSWFPFNLYTSDGAVNRIE